MEWDMMPGVSAAAAADVPKQAICSSRLTEASAATFRRAVQKHYWWGPPCCPAALQAPDTPDRSPWLGGSRWHLAHAFFLRELHAAVNTRHSRPGT